MEGRQNPAGSAPQHHQDDNRANQLNANHDAYWQSRGHLQRPADWQRRLQPPAKP